MLLKRFFEILFPWIYRVVKFGENLTNFRFLFTFSLLLRYLSPFLLENAKIVKDSVAGFTYKER